MSEAAENIYPTHTCFDDALDYLELVLRAQGRKSLRRLVVVHGICLHEETSEPFAHAWVEQGDEVHHAGILRGERVWVTIPRDDYYRELRIQDTTRYTPLEAVRRNRATGHYGPWEPQYQALTRDGKMR